VLPIAAVVQGVIISSTVIFCTSHVYQYNSTILQVPATFMRPLFGWKTVDSFSVDDEERERPDAKIYSTT
jgi:hypothetical protein